MTTAAGISPDTLLTDRQERFVHEYMVDQNARAAARRAGYAGKSAGSQARDLMRNPKVRERIRDGLEELFSGLKITARNLLQQQARVAFFDPRKLFDKAGQPVALDALDEDTASVLLVSYGERKNGDWTRRVRQPSRMQALVALEKRYLKYLELQSDVEEDEAQPEAKREAKPEAAAAPAVQAPAPVPVRVSAPVAGAAVLPAVGTAGAPPVPAGKAGGLLRALLPSWLMDRDEGEQKAVLAAPAPPKKAGQMEEAGKATKQTPPRAIPYHMQFAHLDPPNFAVLRDVPFEEWPEKARKYYKVKPGAAPGLLPAYLSKPRQLYGDPGPVFYD